MDTPSLNHLHLDGHALQLLVAVYEEGSITRAAARLHVTQSAVSHGIERLRTITGNPLFVKSGRGITPTQHTHVLVERARMMLQDLQSFSLSAGFQPHRLRLQLNIAANDLQRDLLLPSLLRHLREQAPGITLRVLTSGAPQPSLLRQGECHLVLTPRPPQAVDVMQRRLFVDDYRVFYDPKYRSAPDTVQDYLDSLHVSVRYESPQRPLDIDEWLEHQGVQRQWVSWVPGFAGLAGMLTDGPWLATAPGRLRHGVLRGLADAPLPLPHLVVPPLAMYMVWHLRFQNDPMHQWLRESLVRVAQSLETPTSTPNTKS